MPIVNVQVTREGTAPGRQSVTEEEKARLIAGVSQMLLKVLNKPLESTYVWTSTTRDGAGCRPRNIESSPPPRAPGPLGGGKRAV